MTEHGALSVQARVISRVLRLSADCGGVEDELGALERHDARCLGEPLVPADGHADPHLLSELRYGDIPDGESRIARSEIELFLIAWSVWNVALAVEAEKGAVAVDDDEGVEEGVAAALEE